jgi:hypothetical protein
MASLGVEVSPGRREARLIGVASRVLYLITSHKNPEQVNRLVRTLRRGSPRSPIVVHHDSSKSDLDPALFDGLNDVHVLPFSIPVEWGDFSIVEMNLRAFEWILGHLEFDWLVLLSGQDYPIKPLADIERFLGSCRYQGLFEEPELVENRVVRRHKGYIDYGPVFRYFFRYWRLPRLPFYPRLPRRVRDGLSRARERFIPRVQRFLFLHPMPQGANLRLGIRRLWTPFNRSFRCYKSSAWFTLSRQAVARVVEFVGKDPRVVRFYRRSVIADESVLQTILLNQSGWEFFNDNMLYLKWGDVGSGSPDVLTLADLEDALASGKHFARKFDMDVDASVLDRLDEWLFAASSAPESPPGVTDT